MNLRVISDLHLSPDSDQNNELFLAFLEDAFQQQDEVLIAGDLFHLWFGWSDLTFPYQKKMIQRMRELSSAGLTLHYVEGNRDFGIERYRSSIFATVSASLMEMQWGAHRIFIVHGDLINKKDKQYRFWRKVSKNPVSFFLLDHLPSSFLLRMASRIESGMKKTNQKYRMEFPEKACRDFSASCFAEGADIVIVGHFHEERISQENQGRKDVLFYSLPGWEHGFRYLVIPRGDEQPYFKDHGR